MNLVVYGTRAEEIKLYPFTKHDGFEFLEVDQSKDLHQNLIVPHHRAREEKLEGFIKRNGHLYNRVMVQGDTRTAFRASVFAFEHKLLIVHVEAGLRTWDINDPHPEEGYRRMIDEIATYKFCSTEEAAKNCNGVYVGQTSIDTLFEFYPKDVKQEDFYIVTVHRNESHDKLEEIVGQLREMESRGEDLHVYAHPNRVGQALKQYFNCLPPLPYREFVKEMAKCKGFVSDSGGLQEEAIALGKEFISLREKSERGHSETYEPGATAKIVEYLK